MKRVRIFTGLEMNPFQIFNGACCHIFRIDALNCLNVRIGFYYVEIKNLIDQIRNSQLYDRQKLVFDWPCLCNHSLAHGFSIENPLIDWMAFRHPTKFWLEKSPNAFKHFQETIRAKSNVTIFCLRIKMNRTLNLSIGLKLKTYFYFYKIDVLPFFGIICLCHKYRAHSP